MPLFNVHRPALDPLDVLIGAVVLTGFLLVGWLVTGGLVGTGFDVVTPAVADGTVQSDVFGPDDLVAVVYGLVAAVILVPLILGTIGYVVVRRAAYRPPDRFEPWA